MKPLVFVVGPTACGKSRVAHDLAKQFGGAILNCDSLQVYKRLDIGTAKPTPSERKEVPHFLFDICEPGSSLTAGDFRKLALECLHRELQSKPVFAVGGSGFYIQALEKGMFEVEKGDAKTEESVRERLAREGSQKLHEELRSHDPEYAEEINPNDAYRIVRALVVVLSTGKKMSDLRKSFQPQPLPFPNFKIGLNLDREKLIPRVQARVEQMMKDGFLREVEKLLDEGFEEWPALHSVGYHECIEHVRGRLPFGQLIPLIVEKTMQLAKKQRTWFKRDASIHWLNAENPLAEARDYVRTRIHEVTEK